MSATTVPPYYKFMFLYFDPLCSSWGAYMDLFAPATVMAAYNPTAIHTRTQDVLFQQLAGPFIMIAFLSTFLLRHTQDLHVWKLYHTSVALVDVVMLYSFYDSLTLQGRLPFGRWEVADWANVGVTVLVLVTRVAFVAGLGLPKTRTGAKKSM